MKSGLKNWKNKQIIPNKHHFVGAPLLLALLLFFGSCSQQGKNLKIAAAANTQFALKEIARKFESQYDAQVDLVFGASGSLTTKIKQGAPYDIFISADLKYPDTLFNMGFARNKPRVYAHGRLVLWTLKDLILKPGMEILTDPVIHKIAIPNPKIAPYGKAAVESLQHYEIYDKINNKLIYGNNVGQTNHFILTKSCDVGITAMSAVESPKMKKHTNWIPINQNTYQTIKQGAIVLQHGYESQPEVCEKFYDFLFSEEARETLENFGYLTP